jgi:hypothetical protein
MHVLMLLREMGLDPHSEARRERSASSATA